MQIRSFSATSAFVPTTGYSQATEVAGAERLVFVSGQTPTRADGTVPEGFEAQAKLVWQNIEAQLKEAGMTLDNIVKHTTFLADRRYAIPNRAVRIATLGDRAPAATVIICGIFDESWLIEVEAIAAA